MSDLFDDLNKIFKKDLVPIFVKYFKDPNNKIIDNINDFLNDSRISLTDIFEKLAKNKENDIDKGSYTDDESIIDNDTLNNDDDYDNLIKHLILIEENMFKLEKLLKDKN